MALNANACGTAIHNAIQALGSGAEDPETVWQTAISTLFLHITTNAVVTVPIEATDNGLQTSAAAGAPTTGPAAPTSLDGTIL